MNCWVEYPRHFTDQMVSNMKIKDCTTFLLLCLRLVSLLILASSTISLIVIAPSLLFLVALWLFSLSLATFFNKLSHLIAPTSLTNIPSRLTSHEPSTYFKLKQCKDLTKSASWLPFFIVTRPMVNDKEINCFFLFMFKFSLPIVILSADFDNKILVHNNSWKTLSSCIPFP